MAHAYGLSKDEYQTVLDSFKFDEDSLDVEAVDWSDNKTLKKFYGGVRRAAMDHFEAIAGGSDPE